MIATGSDRLIEAIRYQTEKVSIICNDANMLPDLAVHEIRKAFKRLVAFLKFYPDDLSLVLNEYSRQIKGIARQLTEARESAVNLVLLDRLLETGTGMEGPTKETMIQYFSNENIRFVTSLFREKKIGQETALLMDRLKSELLPKLSGSGADINFAFRLVASYQKAYDLYNLLQGNYDPVQYHELRKLMKTLYYQFEVATAGQEATFLTDSEQLDKLTELLGEDHDWFIFLNECKGVKCALNTKEESVVGSLVKEFQKGNMATLNSSLSGFFQGPFISHISGLSHF